jgi:phosphate transport system substrate-binding protein
MNSRISSIRSIGLAAFAVLALGAATPRSCTAAKLQGSVRVDGSSTVFPLTEAVAEEFRTVQPKVRVSVGFSGTGGGFKKFHASETDINDASRPIKETELAQCREAGVEFIELPVAYDGIAVVVSRENAFVDHLTTAELKKLWEPGSTVQTWQDVRAAWPALPIKLYGPGTDSGTFDYVTEAINGKSQSCRSDFTASEDDNVLVQGVAGDKAALGFFGFSYYDENKERLKIVPIDGGSGSVVPNLETIKSGAYAPLSRPIFIYVTTVAAERPEVREFVKFYLDNAGVLAEEVGAVPLPDSVYGLVRQRFESRITGTVYSQGQHAPLETLYALPSRS